MPTAVHTTSRAVALLALVAACALVVAGCGKSKEDKAQTAVCNARADIQKQVDTLTSMSAGTVSITQVEDALKAIQNDLSTIKNEQPNLKPARQQQVQQAVSTFGAEVATAAKEALSSLNADKLKANVKTAAQTLASGVKQALGPIDCSSA